MTAGQKVSLCNCVVLFVLYRLCPGLIVASGVMSTILSDVKATDHISFEYSAVTYGDADQQNIM